MVKEEAVTMTDKLDEDWKSIMNLMSKKVHLKESCLPITMIVLIII